MSDTTKCSKCGYYDSMGFKECPRCGTDTIGVERNKRIKALEDKVRKKEDELRNVTSKSERIDKKKKRKTIIKAIFVIVFSAIATFVIMTVIMTLIFSLYPEEKKTGVIRTRELTLPDYRSSLRYTDILLSPYKFVGRQVTIQGTFFYKNTEEEWFKMQQGDHIIMVFYKRLPRKAQASILNQNDYSSSRPVTVKGTLYCFANMANTYYIMASAISWK